MICCALSIIQPWPWLILRPDLVSPADRAAARAAGKMKDCENREWETPVRGWVLLHASNTRLAKWFYQGAALFAAKRGVDIPMRDSLPYGAIVGAIRIDGCTSRPCSSWFTGPHAFLIGDSVPFETPIGLLGALRFFQLSADITVERRIEALIRAAGIAKQFNLEDTP